MKVLLIISTIVLFCSCTKMNRTIVCPDKICPPAYIILFSGESNAGGKGTNTDATPYELSVRKPVNVLNNDNLLFEPLHIGVNNMLGYNGLPPLKTTVHGWELGLANSADSNNLQTPVYLVKTAMGGSKAKDWTIGNPNGYWDTLTKRMDKARTLVTQLNGGVIPYTYMWYSLGINDAGNSPDTAIFKVRVKQIFANVRARYGRVPIFMTYIPDIFPTYNAAITGICNEVQECYAIETRDLPTFPDHIHWPYASLKIIAQRIITEMNKHYKS